MALPKSSESNLRSLARSLLGRRQFVFLRALLERPKASVYLVGGPVRDALLGKEAKDLDFLVTGVAKKTLEKLLREHGTVKEIESRAFGVFKFMPQGYAGEEALDIALPRTERPTGLGYKDFAIHTDPRLGVEDDLARRDFTINAIAYDLRHDMVVDPFGGRADLSTKIIRAVGKPAERFAEDPSRILRAVRLAVELGVTINAATLSAAKKKVPEINRTFRDREGVRKERVAREVIGREFVRAFHADAVRTLKEFERLGLLKLLLPEALAMKRQKQPRNFHAEGTVWVHSLLALTKLEHLAEEIRQAAGFRVEVPPPTAELKLAVLLHDVGKPIVSFFHPERGRTVFYGHDTKGAQAAGEIIERLKLSVYPKESPLHIDKEKVTWLIKQHLFALNLDVTKVSLGAIKKRFFRDDGWGRDLRALMWADTLASIKEDGSYNMERMAALERVVQGMEKELATKVVRPEPLLSGNEIMRLLSLNPSRLVGIALDTLLELQLTGKVSERPVAEKTLLSCRAIFSRTDRELAGLQKAARAGSLDPDVRRTKEDRLIKKTQDELGKKLRIALRS